MNALIKHLKHRENYTGLNLQVRQRGKVAEGSFSDGRQVVAMESPNNTENKRHGY